MMSTEAVAIVSVYRMKSDRKSLSCFLSFSLYRSDDSMSMTLPPPSPMQYSRLAIEFTTERAATASLPAKLNSMMLKQ